MKVQGVLSLVVLAMAICIVGWKVGRDSADSRAAENDQRRLREAIEIKKAEMAIDLQRSTARAEERKLMSKMREIEIESGSYRRL